jgi:hypothetical protein
MMSEWCQLFNGQQNTQAASVENAISTYIQQQLRIQQQQHAVRWKIDIEPAKVNASRT